MKNIENLKKYKNPYYFKRYETYEDFVNHQLTLFVKNRDLEDLRERINANCLSLDYAIMRMKVCNINSLDFYAKYLLYSGEEKELVKEGIKVIVGRFKVIVDVKGEVKGDIKNGDRKRDIQEDANNPNNSNNAIRDIQEDTNNDTLNTNTNIDTLKIYNILRPLVNLLTLKDVLELLNFGILNILIGEFGRKNSLAFESLKENNLYLKFLGFFSVEDFKEIENLEELIAKDQNILKIITSFDKNHFYLKNLLIDRNLQFYLSECDTNLDLLKEIYFPPNAYSQYLLLNLLREENNFIIEKLSSLNIENLITIFVLFARDKNWINKYSEDLKRTNLEGIFCIPEGGREEAVNKRTLEDLKRTNLEVSIPGGKSEEIVNKITNKIINNRTLGLVNPLNMEGGEVALNFSRESKNEYNFNIFKEIENLIYFTNKLNLKEIDNFLFENYCLVELKVYLDSHKDLEISNWLDSKEVFFSQVVKRSFLKDFHSSFLLNNKKRNQMAYDLLRGENRDTFLSYLDRRGIYIELDGVEYDFSVKWLNLFVEEHSKSLKIIFWEKQTQFIKKGGELKINKNKFKLLKIKRREEEKPKRTKIEEMNGSRKGGIKECSLESPNDTKGGIKEYSLGSPNDTKLDTKTVKDVLNLESFFKNILENKLEEELVGFNRFGLLNNFISSHLEDPEGCARVASSVILSNSQSKTFLRTLQFVIEEKKILSNFTFNFLKFCKFEIDLLSILPYLDLNTPLLFLVLPCKIKVSDLDFLVENYYDGGGDLERGFLLRGYSYLQLPPTKGGYKKVKDKAGDKEFVFYYSKESNLKFKYQNISFTMCNKHPEEFYSLIRGFTNCTKRKEILKRIQKVVGGSVDKNGREGDLDKGGKESVLEKGGKGMTHTHSNPPNTHPTHPPFDILNLLKTTRGDEESLILQSLKNHPFDQSLLLYTLNNFHYFSFSTKIYLLSNFNIQINQKLFIKFCETIANEDNLKILRILIGKIKEYPNKDIIEEWKTNPKLERLMVRIYPLSYKDRDFYANLYKKYKYEEEKEMLKEFYNKELQ